MLQLASIADTEKRKLDLKAKEVELEDLQQFSEMRRNIIGEQRRQFELLKTAEVKTLSPAIFSYSDLLKTQHAFYVSSP